MLIASAAYAMLTSETSGVGRSPNKRATPRVTTSAKPSAARDAMNVR
jgi:hypothetical protein